MNVNIGRYSIVSILLLTAVIALSIALYQTNQRLRSVSEVLSSAWQARWPNPDNLNALLTTKEIDIVDFEQHSAAASWRVLVPDTGTYCLRWKAGLEASPNSVVLPSGFSDISLELNENSGAGLKLGIDVGGTRTVDQLRIDSPLIEYPVSFSAAGMQQTFSIPPNRHFPLFHLFGLDQNSQDGFEIWIEPIPAKAMLQNNGVNPSPQLSR